MSYGPFLMAVDWMACFGGGMAGLTVRCSDQQFQNISAILWDKDGTLADSHGFLKELAKRRSHHLNQQVPGIYDELMVAFGCAADRYDPAGLMAVGTRYENEIAAAAYVASQGYAWADSLQRVQASFAESDRHVTRKAEWTPPFEDIPELLQQAQQQGLLMAVLSGDTTANIQDFLNCYNLAATIAWSAGSEAPPVKPDPQMVWTACDQLGVSPNECLVIGDSALDQQLAHNGQCAGFVSVTWGGSPAIADADAVLTTPQALQWLP
jgi:phosphoglycolate phosphatase